MQNNQMKLFSAYLGFYLYFASMSSMITRVVPSITKKSNWLK